MTAMLASAQGASHVLERLFHQKQEISIGRNPSNTIVLNATISPERPIPDSLVLQLSRQHAKLTVKDGELQIMDNGTLNGTFINNLRIPAKSWRVLKNGDVISLGGTNPLELNGVVEDNPWTFKVKQPEEFLARYVAPSSLPNAETQSQGGGVRPSAERPREVYTFSGERPRETPRATRPRVQAEVIDLTFLEDSPPPRPKSASRKASKDASHGHDSKRARPTSTADIPSQPPSAPAAGGGDGAVTNGIVEEFTCPICQELIVAAYNLVPCGHNFCGVCLSNWLVTKQECPNCRQRCTAPPTRANGVDNIIALTVKGLDEEEKKSYEERRQDWENRKATLEPKIKDPTKFAGRGGGGAYGGGRHPQPHGGGAMPPFVSMVPGMLNGQYGVPAFLLQGVPGATALIPQQPGAQRAMRNAPRREAQPPGGEQRFRCQYAAGPLPCKGCRRGVNNGELILGMKLAQPRSADYDWYHFGCFPQAGFRNARVVGFENMRNVSPADASRIRERLVIR